MFWSCLKNGLEIFLRAKKIIEIFQQNLASWHQSEKRLTQKFRWMLFIKTGTFTLDLIQDMSLMNRDGSLAFYEILGDASLINSELQRYQEVTAENILEESRIIFDEKNSSTLHYYAKN